VIQDRVEWHHQRQSIALELAILAIDNGRQQGLLEYSLDQLVHLVESDHRQIVFHMAARDV